MTAGQHLKDCRAIAALEFALTLPVLLILLGGVVDFGQAMYYRNAIANGIAAGAQYAVVNAGTATTATIQSMVQTVSGLSTAVSVTVTPKVGYCVVVNNQTGAALTAGTTCSDNSPAGTYYIISASYSFSGLLGTYSVPSLFTISDSTTVRVQ
jgi:Flp pilus assembly protein TadG